MKTKQAVTFASILLALIAAALGYFVWDAGIIREPPKPHPLAGKPAPHVKLADLEHPGKVVDVATLPHKLTVITVWTSWCDTCGDRIRELALLKEKYGSAINLIGVVCEDKRRDALRWIQRAGNPFDVTLYDPTKKFEERYAVLGFPTSLLIDENGAVMDESFNIEHAVDNYMSSRKGS